jgi:CelD/BcsL family acetyltransferase involved in cellulose biosynthesis
MTLVISRHQNFEEIGETAWEELLGRCAESSIFQTYAWNSCWWSAKQSRGRTLVLLAARDGERLVGLAPLYHEERAFRAGRLQFVGHGNSDYLDFLVAEAGGEVGAVGGKVAAALVEAALSIPERWQTFHAADLPEWSALRRALEATPGRLRWRRLPDTPCPGLRRAAHEPVFQRATESKMLRKNSKLLVRAGVVETRHGRTAAEIQPHLERFFAMHVQRWSATPYPSLFLAAENRDFYRRLVERMSPERLLFTVVLLDEVPVAFHFGFVHAAKLLFYKPTYDVAHSKLSPGSTLLVELFRWCEDNAMQEFDFTRGDEAFKDHFANHLDRNANYVGYRRRTGLWCDTALDRARGLGRKLLRRR